MELTDRERRILAELDHQLSTGTPESLAPPPEKPPARDSLRPHWTILPAAVMGTLLLGAGIALGVTEAVLLGTLLVVWSQSPLLWRLVRSAGRSMLESLENTPPDARR